VSRPAEGDKARLDPSRGGFSLIEVIIATVILTAGLLGMAGTTGYIVRTVTLSDLMTERSTAFQTVVDRLQSLPYDSVTSGADSVGIFAVSWTTTTDGPQNKILSVVTVGPGLSGGPFPGQDPQVTDTFTFRLLRP